jgi:8-oxo-dGTP diphosphatase
MREIEAPRRESGELDSLVAGTIDCAPAVDVRLVLFTVSSGTLRVNLNRDADRATLPRGVPYPGEALDTAARRIARETTGLREQYLEQLYTLSVDEPAGWTVIIAYLGLVGSVPGTPAVEPWHDVAAPPSLLDTDRMVIDYAVLRLRAKLGYTTIAFHLLPPTFTLSELQHAYETILGQRLDKRNFRRRLIAANVLAATDAKRRDGSHRPALLYRFRAAHDRETYLTPPWADG